LACILKLPSKNSKGVISFTSIEYFSQIYKINHTQKLIKQMKENWIICYHPNWEDMNFHATDIFDATIATKTSFAFKENDKKLNLKILDTSSNRIAPNFFKINKNKKWDFFHVSRYEPRKNILGFFKVVKSALKKSDKLSGILLISVLPNKLNEVRALYKNYFTEKQREQFELITLDYDLPFPLSKKILAHFYNFSKVSLNTHLNEPHGRVVGYSLASGLPIVGFLDLTRMVSEEIRKEPFFFVSENQNDLSDLLLKAIEYVDKEYDIEKHKKVSNLYSEVDQKFFLKNKLISTFDLDNDGWYLNNLDLRLSSHFLYYDSTNEYIQSVLDLVYYLSYKKDNFSSLSSLDNYTNLESSIVNEIKKFEFNKPFKVKLLDYILCKKFFIKKKIIINIKLKLKKILPRFIVQAMKKFLKKT
jgi:glycosyltransferase involved in cell wall biosynthesis